jgi:hypothetical protein
MLLIKTMLEGLLKASASIWEVYPNARIHDCHSEPKAKNLRLLPLTMNEILRLRLRMDNRDTSANFAMQRHRKFLAEFRLRASE